MRITLAIAITLLSICIQNNTGATAQSRANKTEVIVTVTNQDDQPIKSARVILDDKYEGSSCTTGKQGSCSLFVNSKSNIGQISVFYNKPTPMGSAVWQRGMSIVAVVIRR